MSISGYRWSGSTLTWTIFPVEAYWNFQTVPCIHISTGSFTRPVFPFSSLISTVTGIGSFCLFSIRGAAARRHGGTAARRHGGTAARRHGGTAARRHGGTAARRHGGTAARRHGGTAARRHGGTAARRHGGTAARRAAAAPWSCSSLAGSTEYRPWSGAHPRAPRQAIHALRVGGERGVVRNCLTRRARVRSWAGHGLPPGLARARTRSLVRHWSLRRPEPDELTNRSDGMGAQALAARGSRTRATAS